MCILPSILRNVVDAATVRISARAKSMGWREINRTPFVPRIVSNAGPVWGNARLEPLISRRIRRFIVPANQWLPGLTSSGIRGRRSKQNFHEKKLKAFVSCESKPET
jgi:hypothetical protein